MELNYKTRLINYSPGRKTSGSCKPLHWAAFLPSPIPCWVVSVLKSMTFSHPQSIWELSLWLPKSFSGWGSLNGSPAWGREEGENICHWGNCVGEWTDEQRAVPWYECAKNEIFLWPLLLYKMLSLFGIFLSLTNTENKKEKEKEQKNWGLYLIYFSS